MGLVQHIITEVARDKPELKDSINAKIVESILDVFFEDLDIPTLKSFLEYAEGLVVDDFDVCECGKVGLAYVCGEDGYVCPECVAELSACPTAPSGVHEAKEGEEVPPVCKYCGEELDE